MIAATIDVFDDILDIGAIVTSPKLQERISPPASAKSPTLLEASKPLVTSNLARHGRTEYQMFNALAAEGGRHGARANYS
jgi:hypothetical protein